MSDQDERSETAQERENGRRESERPPFYKDGWFWTALFFMAVCVIGSFAGRNSAIKSDSLAGGKYFTASTESSSVSVSDNTVSNNTSSSDAATETSEKSQNGVSETSPESESKEKTTAEESSADKNTVYITPTGSRYHFSKRCAGKNAIKTDIASAKEKYSPCQRCVK
ncbi:MAG: hypothetical protein PUB94_04630 [Oscillospiraceae bacterium]|nr:hypothetical protein [Oscillospiraceae bacterium]